MARVMDAARHLRPRDRGRFLQAVALELRGRADIGDGDVNAALRSALTRFEQERLTWVA
jgi:hypothetical protein